MEVIIMPEQTITRENEIELLLEIANKGLKKQPF